MTFCSWSIKAARVHFHTDRWKDINNGKQWKTMKNYEKNMKNYNKNHGPFAAEASALPGSTFTLPDEKSLYMTNYEKILSDHVKDTRKCVLNCLFVFLAFLSSIFFVFLSLFLFVNLTFLSDQLFFLSFCKTYFLVWSAVLLSCIFQIPISPPANFKADCFHRNVQKLQVVTLFHSSFTLFHSGFTLFHSSFTLFHSSFTLFHSGFTNNQLECYFNDM